MKVIPKLCDIAKEVATHLPGYAVAPNDERHGDLSSFDQQSCRLIRHTEAQPKFVIQFTSVDFGHIQIGGRWPRSKRDRNKTYPVWVGELPPVATADYNEAPELIAEKLRRSFLPALERAFKEGIEERNQADDTPDD